MTWSDYCLWWHIYPLGFCGAPIRETESQSAGSQEAAVHSQEAAVHSQEAAVHSQEASVHSQEELHAEAPHRLRKLNNWLSYAIDLGLSGISLGPIFASETHGYDSIDQYRIDPRLGDDADFDDLVKRCKEKGMHIVLDGVFNHLGENHPFFQDVLAKGRDSKYADFFKIDWDSGTARDAARFEGHYALVELNHDGDLSTKTSTAKDSAAVNNTAEDSAAEDSAAEYSVATYVASVMNYWLDRGIDGWRLDAAYAVPPKFWQKVLPQVREKHPDAWIFGEVIHGDYNQIVKESGMNSVTQYELWKAIWSSLQAKNFFELEWCLQRHNEFCTRFRPSTFVGNHDVTRIASQVGPANDVLALVVLLTVGGVPAIYYGDEQGLTGIKEDRIGGDDAVRPEFPDTPTELVPRGWEMYRIHQELLALRGRNPWLVSAQTKTIELSNERYVYVVEASPEVQYDSDAQSYTRTQPKAVAQSLWVELNTKNKIQATIQDGAGNLLFRFKQ